MCRLLLMTIALLLVLFGVYGLWMMPRLIQQKIEQRMQLKINTKTFERFTKVPIPLTVKFYLFNITNGQQVLEGLERPRFQQVGPFMFKQWRRREIVDFEDWNRRLRYREIKTFYPMFSSKQQQHQQQQQLLPIADNIIDNNTNVSRHNSESSHNNDNNNNFLDPHNFNITIINLPLLSALTKLAQLEDGSLKQSVAAKVASNLISAGRDKILVTRPANELLFDGYKVDFMESARDLVSGTLGFPFDSPLPKNTFGFFYRKNNTWSARENGELTVYTGRNDSMDNFMMVENWNDQRQLNVWPKNTEAGDRCNQIRGTDGSQFHPGVTRQQVLQIFSPMVCTSLYIKYKEDTQAKDIPLLRFGTPPELFGAPRKNPQNACYCTIRQHQQAKATSEMRNDKQQQQQHSLKSSPVPAMSGRKIDDSRCYLDGLMDLSLCQRGAPIAASSPHFYNADPMLAMAAGLSPDAKLHETYIDIEPMTGAVFRAASRAQLNAYVERAALDVIDSSVIGHMTPMVAPLLWLEEAAEIDEKSAGEFKNQLLNLVQKAHRMFIYAIIVGIVLAVAVAFQYWYVTCYRIDLTTRSKKIKRQQVKGGKRKRPINRRNGGGNLQANLRLGGSARSSNLEAKKSDEMAVTEFATTTASAAAAVVDDDDDDDNVEDEIGKDPSKQPLVASEWAPPQQSADNAQQAASDEVDLIKPSTSSAGVQ